MHIVRLSAAVAVGRLNQPHEQRALRIRHALPTADPCGAEEQPGREAGRGKCATTYCCQNTHAHTNTTTHIATNCDTRTHACTHLQINAHVCSFRTRQSSTKYYSTKFEPPKKETPKERKLSANIQKFLQKQQLDEQEKKRTDKQKLDDLMSMRDTKSKNKIRKMLKVTKSANKSVLDDAVDGDNTAYTLQGPEQPDEDDYGYVSHEAGQLYRQIMDKYKTDKPDDDKRASRE